MTTEKEFYRRTGEWLDRFLEKDPVAATELGDHRVDDRLGDHSLSALEAQNNEIKAFKEELSRFSTDDWSNDARIDLSLV
ncbi:hypothetical protein DRJ12_01885, partial [Candidatus Acetothermia bacterium]